MKEVSLPCVDMLDGKVNERRSSRISGGMTEISCKDGNLEWSKRIPEDWRILVVPRQCRNHGVSW